jgi:carbonic anhydrase
MNIAYINEKIIQKRLVAANWDNGFNEVALQGLLTILNSEPHIYFYYGSETSPPCKEDVLWAVFAKPRSISQHQFLMLRDQLVRNKDSKLKIKDALVRHELFGNKREVQVIK